jgi:predicted TIM-barrel fold metal-dependent hydrolase
MSGHAEVPGSEIRARLNHPVVDADGHMVECEWLLEDYIREIGGARLHDKWVNRPLTNGVTKGIWWGFPSGPHTADRMMSMLPKYFAARMEECGIDFAHMLTTIGLGAVENHDDELRVTVCRSINTMFADMFRDVSDRLRPVAVIPTQTPAEAIAELEHAVLKLGFKAIMIATEVRPPGEPFRSIAFDPPFDYDPFWRRCVELGVAPMCHQAHLGTQSRGSRTNYVYNHLGMFAAGAEFFCRSLFMGGVTRRFPDLNFGLLEGGVAWAATLLNDIVEHFEKRNPEALLANLDPATLDVDLMCEIADKYGDARFTGARLREQPHHSRGSKIAGSEPFDEFAACEMSDVSELRELFYRNLYFGCEADDRMLAVAFNRKLSPLGLPLKAVFGSDIGHWDVIDATSILAETYGLVDAGLITPNDFRDFTWTNPVTLHLRMNPDYFKGTVVEAEAEKLLPHIARSLATAP